jgi:hypothetical protein
MRNSGRPGYGQLPDIWVSMDTERALLERCRTLDLSLRDLIVNLLEQEVPTADFGWPPPNALERVG